MRVSARRIRNRDGMFDQGRRGRAITPLLLLAAAPCALLAQPAWGADAPAAAPADAEAAETATPADIVVTARYRSEKLQDVPIAITALSAAQITQNPTSFSLRQLQQFLPSVTILGYGQRNISVSIRGLGANAGTAAEGIERGVGIYVDGVYRGRGDATADLLDVDNIQVLRGPQGTLFGKNTVAGAIDIRTRAPTFEPEARVDLTAGNRGYIRGQATVSGPLGDKVAVRLSGSRLVRDGIVYNVRYNQKWEERKSYNLKADLLFRPSDTFSARIIGDYYTIYGIQGLNTIAAILPARRADGSTVRDFYTRAAQVGYVPQVFGPFDRKTDIDSRMDSRVKSGGVQGRLEWDLGPVALTSITAHRFWNFYPHYDADQFGADIYRYGSTAPHQKQFSQELRVNSTGTDALQYTAGLFYYREKSVNTTRAIFGSDAAKWLVSPASPDDLLTNLEGYSVGVPITTSYAAYGQATWQFTPRLSATAGLRYTYEKKFGSYHAEQRGTAVPILQLPLAAQATAQATRNSFAPPTGDYAASQKKGNISGTASLRYEPTDDVSLYATYSRGYKSAGVNLIAPGPGQTIFLRPERHDAYEVGLKSQFLDRRVTFNLALFWTDVSDYQSSLYDFSRRQFFYSNAGKVRTRGVEVDTRVTPIDRLTLFASGSYTDADYLVYRAALCPFALSYMATCDISGQRLAGVSKWAGSLGGEYSVPIAAGPSIYLNGDVSYRSSYYSAANDDPFTRIRSYALANARIGVRDPDLRWDVSLYVSNLFNKDYFNTLSVSNSLGTAIGVVGEPRMYGINVRTQF